MLHLQFSHNPSFERHANLGGRPYVAVLNESTGSRRFGRELPRPTSSRKLFEIEVRENDLLDLRLATWRDGQRGVRRSDYEVAKFPSNLFRVNGDGALTPQDNERADYGNGYSGTVRPANTTWFSAIRRQASVTRQDENRELRDSLPAADLDDIRPGDVLVFAEPAVDPRGKRIGFRHVQFRVDSLTPKTFRGEIVSSGGPMSAQRQGETSLRRTTLARRTVGLLRGARAQEAAAASAPTPSLPVTVQPSAVDRTPDDGDPTPRIVEPADGNPARNQTPDPPAGLPVRTTSSPTESSARRSGSPRPSVTPLTDGPPVGQVVRFTEPGNSTSAGFGGGFRQVEARVIGRGPKTARLQVIRATGIRPERRPAGQEFGIRLNTLARQMAGITPTAPMVGAESARLRGAAPIRLTGARAAGLRGAPRARMVT